MTRPPRRPPAARRAGVTLLELVLAGTLAAAVTGSLHVALRGVRTAAVELSGETNALRRADAALRFVVRRCREARAVTAVDAAAPEFTLTLADGRTGRFFLPAGYGGRVLNFAVPGAGGNRTVSDGLSSFAPAFYLADAVTPTTDPALVRVIEITLAVDLPRDHAPGRTVSSRVWVRRW